MQLNVFFTPPTLQVLTGALLGGYESLRFKSKKSPTATRLDNLHLMLPQAPELDKAVAKAHATAGGALITRCLKGALECDSGYSFHTMCISHTSLTGH